MRKRLLKGDVPFILGSVGEAASMLAQATFNAFESVGPTSQREMMLHRIEREVARLVLKTDRSDGVTLDGAPEPGALCDPDVRRAAVWRVVAAGIAWLVVDEVDRGSPAVEKGDALLDKFGNRSLRKRAS